MDKENNHIENQTSIQPKPKKIIILEYKWSHPKAEGMYQTEITRPLDPYYSPDDARKSESAWQTNEIHSRMKRGSRYSSPSTYPT